MHPLDESKVRYLDAPVPDDLFNAAQGVPGQIGYDRYSEEVYLAGGVTAIRWVTDACAQADFHLANTELEGPPATLLRIDYESWALAGEFDAANPERVVHRREHIYAKASALRDAGIFSYGPEADNGFEHWNDDECTEGLPVALKLPVEAMAEIHREISSRRMDEIAEYLAEDGAMPEGASRRTLKLYRDIAKTIERDE